MVLETLETKHVLLVKQHRCDHIWCTCFTHFRTSEWEKHSSPTYKVSYHCPECTNYLQLAFYVLQVLINVEVMLLIIYNSYEGFYAIAAGTVGFLSRA